MPLNVPLLLAVKKQILAEPRTFDMALFYSNHGSRSVKNPVRPICNTVLCIGGWAIALTARLLEQEFSNADEVFAAYCQASGPDSGIAATEQLGLNHEDLLYVTQWPIVLYAEYVQAENDNDWLAMAEVAARAIDSVIAGNGDFTEWLNAQGEYIRG